MHQSNRRSSKFLQTVAAAAMGLVMMGTCIPLPAFAQEPAADPMYAGYAGGASAKDTSLPDTILVNGQAQPVEWDVEPYQLRRYYSTVEVTGTAGEQKVTAAMEIIPENLVYFIDVGTAGDNCGQGWNSPSVDSMPYQAVAGLASLKNDAPDGAFSADKGWGYEIGANKSLVQSTVDNGNIAAAFTSYDKYGVGFRDKSAGKFPMRYKMNLPAGDYTMTLGFHEFYPNTHVRDMSVKLYAGETLIADGGTVQMRNADLKHSVEFTLDKETTVELQLQSLKVGTNPYEAGMYSWIAVAQGHIQDAIEAADEVTEPTVVVDGADVEKAAKNVNGLTFKGFGTLSCSSTSSLLMDYKAEHPEKYAEMLEILFGGENPLMTHVKIELGNDQNSSTGPDPATMRTEDEPANVKRAPGFQFAADALKLNPDLQVSVLRWEMPKWVQDSWGTGVHGNPAGYEAMYKWYKETILAAYREYGYMVTYVSPDKNETWDPDTEWIKWYAQRVATDTEGFESETEQKLYNAIKIIASDEYNTTLIGPEVIADDELRQWVDVVGYHYNTDDSADGAFKRLAEEFDMQVWNSEMQATFGSSAIRPNNNTKDPSVAGTGFGGKLSALEMGNTIIKSFVESRRTHFIYQPGLDASYEGVMYGYKDLLSMRDPWSGYIDYDPALHVLQHFTQFSKVGWENETNTAGIWRVIPNASASGATGTNPANGRNGSMCHMTLAAPDKTDFSTVIINDSEYQKEYLIEVRNMELSTASLEVWETRAADEGEQYNSNYMQHVADVERQADGLYHVTVKPWSMVTVTSLDKSAQADRSWQKLPEQNIADRTVLDTDSTGAVQNTQDSFIYADDFEYEGKKVHLIAEDGSVSSETVDYVESRGGAMSATPRYTNDMNGAFEVFTREDGNRVLRQQVTERGGTWVGGDAIVAIGDFRWSNYTVSADVLFESDSTVTDNYATVSARQQGGPGNNKGNPDNARTRTAYSFRVRPDGRWDLIRYEEVLKSGQLGEAFRTGANVWNNVALTVAGNTVTAFVNDVRVVSYEDAAPQLSGRIAFSTGYVNVQYDNLKVEMVEGYAPYYVESLDNLQFDDLTAAQNVKLQYEGTWSHDCGISWGMTQRTLSKTSTPGSSVSYTFRGTGIDLYSAAYQIKDAVVAVVVDGVVIDGGMHAIDATNFEPTCILRGLPYGEHTVTFKLVSGTLAIDEVKIVGGNAQGTADPAVIETAIERYGKLSQSDFGENEAGWAMYSKCLEMAQAAAADPASYRLDWEGADQIATRLKNASVVDAVAAINTVLHFAALQGALPELPETLSVTTQSGETKQNAVEWSIPSADAFNTAFATVEVTGQLYGWAQPVVAKIEVVPENLEWFIDSGVNGEETPPFGAVKALVPELNNEVADQPKTAENEWGYNAGDTVLVTAADASDKHAGGMYATGGGSTAKTIQYTLPMEKGLHQISVGLTEWWNQPRSIKITANWTENGQPKSQVLVESISISGTDRKIAAGNLNLPVSTDVVIRLERVENSPSGAPTIAWLAVAQMPDQIVGFENPERLATSTGKVPALPETVTAVYASGKTDQVAVEWNVSETDFAASWELVSLKGTCEGTDRMPELLVEVVPENLIWFIDSGAQNGTSEAFEAIRKFASGLRNEKADQEMTGSALWGYDASTVSFKGGDIDYNNKNLTGIYGTTGTTGELTYTIPLEQGVYTVSALFHEWWSVAREMKLVAVWTDASGTEQTTELVPGFSSSGEVLKEAEFTLPVADETVKIQVQLAGGNELPILSWLAVAYLRDVEPLPTATPEPTAAPTAEPTAAPTAEPTAAPTAEPTAAPTAEPTAVPTAEPTAAPTAEPTAAPTAEPTAAPTAEPTAAPTAEPTATPTAEPTAAPTAEPTAAPTAEPTAAPTAEPTATPTAAPTATPAPTEVPETGDVALDIQESIDTVPEGLKDTAFNTVEKITRQLYQAAAEAVSGLTEGNSKVYDVTLMTCTEDGTWVPATAENFPKEGVVVKLPYPEGTSGETHEFVVTHMFTTAMGGNKPGDVELPAVTETETGIQFTVYSLSPIGLSWKTAEPAPTPAPTPEATRQPTAPTPTAAPEASGPSSPQTGDSGVLAVAAVVMVAAAGLAVIEITRRARRAEGKEKN